MILTLFSVLLVLWFLGVATGATFSGLIHLLAVLAIGLLILELAERRRPAL